MRRIIYLFGIVSLLCCINAAASSMDAAYSQGESFGNANQSQTQQDAQNPDYSTIPNYAGTNVPEAQYSGDLTAQARQAIRTGNDPTGAAIDKSIAENPEQQAPSSIGNTAGKIQTNASKTLTDKIYCDNDSCTDTTYTAEPLSTFAKSTSALSGAIAAGDDADAKLRIRGWLFKKRIHLWVKTFKGDNLQCRDMGFINGGQYDNCCSNDGWGQKIGLAGCNEEENTLWQDKGKDWCVYVGEYCSNKTLGICDENKQSYCCFDSVLAKIIQEQGRAQLGISFGTPDSANCSGLTPDQLQQIDFSKIDFSEFYSTLETELDIPDSAAVQQELQRDMQEMFQSGNPT